MKFLLPDHDKKRNIPHLFRQVGYHFDREENNELVFYRLIHGAAFPRFHLYVKETAAGWEANLHLDQKAPSYHGTAAHAGEYDSEVVDAEVKRIKRALDTGL